MSEVRRCVLVATPTSPPAQALSVRLVAVRIPFAVLSEPTFSRICHSDAGPDRTPRSPHRLAGAPTLDSTGVPGLSAIIRTP